MKFDFVIREELIGSFFARRINFVLLTVGKLVVNVAVIAERMGRDLKDAAGDNLTVSPVTGCDVPQVTGDAHYPFCGKGQACADFNL